jgi:dextranase
MELIPTRSWFADDESVELDLDAPTPADAVLSVWHIATQVHRQTVPAGSTHITVGVLPRGGYGVELRARTSVAATAFDVLADAFERPRYGFVVTLTDEVDARAVARTYRRLHLNLAQLYDWAYRHSQLMPPTEHYTDPLGQERDLGAVNRMCAELAGVGVVPLGYSAVYAIGSAERDHWPDSQLVRPDGEPYRLGEDFLVLVDPSEPRWLAHYLEQLAAVVDGSGIAGFHLDQYGWPKFALRSDGARVDLAAAFPAVLAAVRRRLPRAPFMFNNVNDFPTYATARSPQNATYIEVWPPHSTLDDLGRLATAARSHRPEHPPILSAYLSCYAEGEHSANVCATLVMATVFSHGATHLLLGEDSNVLTDPYYPRNHRISPASMDLFVRWYDFQVRYGDLLLDPAQVDVTEFFTGGINEDIVLSGPDGVVFSTKATPGTVWTRVVRTSRGLVIHLINLVGQDETAWDAGKRDPSPQAGITLRLAPVAEPPVLIWATPDADDGTPHELAGRAEGAGSQADALSAGQTYAVYDLPTVTTWALVLLPSSALV